jgi:hypothetical protein
MRTLRSFLLAAREWIQDSTRSSRERGQVTVDGAFVLIGTFTG